MQLARSGVLLWLSRLVPWLRIHTQVKDNVYYIILVNQLDKDYYTISVW